MENYADKQLIADYLKGNEEALEILIHRYLKPIYSFVYRYVGDGEAAEDITQEVFVRVWRNLKKFNPRRSRFATLRGRQDKSFKTWLFSIAKNASIDFLRKKRAIPFSEFENEEGKNFLVEKLKDLSPLPPELFEKKEIVKILNSAIEKLSLKYRSVLFLRYNDHFTPLEVRSAVGRTASAIGGLPLTGFTFREIAQALGEPLDTVKSRHRRALVKLKKLLSDF